MIGHDINNYVWPKALEISSRFIEPVPIPTDRGDVFRHVNEVGSALEDGHLMTGGYERAAQSAGRENPFHRSPVRAYRNPNAV